MYRKQGAFQLEKTVPGTFLMQGLLGGVLGGFIAALAATIAWGEDKFLMTLDLTSLAVFTGGSIGMIKATLMWGVVRLTGIQYRAVTRVAATTILAFVSIAVIGRQVDFDGGFLRGCLIWTLSVGISVALLVGSRVKPWKLFTFGSIAAGDVDQRSRLRKIVATLGTLPLRFGSIVAIALLLLYAAEFTRETTIDNVLAISFYLSVALFYPLFSAYVSFRSPRKIVLFGLGVVINIPMILLTVLGFRAYLERPQYGEQAFLFAMIFSSFLGAWVIFLIARLGAKLSPASSLSITSNKSIAAAPNLDHQCLGSRFSEWQHHAA